MTKLLGLLATGATAASLACSAPASDARAPAASGSQADAPHVLLDRASIAGWPNDPRASAWLAGNDYHLLAREPGRFVAVRAPIGAVPASVDVTARFHKVGGPPGGGYGIIVDDRGAGRGDGLDQAGQYVVAEVGDRGQVGIWRRDNSQWADLLAWTPSAAVAHDAAPNELHVHTQGTQLRFEVNGTLIAQLDTGLTGSRVGAFVGGDGNEVVLERFSVSEPVAVAAQPAAPRPQPQPAPDPSPFERIKNLLLGIADDVQGIFESFAGGPDDPHGPVQDRAALQKDASRFESAQNKARDLADELDKLQHSQQP